MTGQETLIPEIRGLKGNRAYCVGIDRENNAMTNVSVWDTRGDAEQMATLQPMLNLAKIFIMPGCVYRYNLGALDLVCQVHDGQAHFTAPN
jgi:hypothetical protein